MALPGQLCLVRIRADWPFVGLRACANLSYEVASILSGRPPCLEGTVEPFVVQAPTAAQRFISKINRVLRRGMAFLACCARPYFKQGHVISRRSLTATIGAIREGRALPCAVNRRATIAGSKTAAPVIAGQGPDLSTQIVSADWSGICGAMPAPARQNAEVLNHCMAGYESLQGK